MNKTSISYADLTWNPFLGCSRASDGCRFCYAERLASTRLAHLPAYHGLTTNGKWNGTIRMLPERLDEPLRRRKPAVIFVGDMGDLFHESISYEFIASVWATMILSHTQTFLVLTKRPGRMLEAITDPAFHNAVLDAAESIRRRFPSTFLVGVSNPAKSPAANIWLGTTVENQREADRRIPLLLKTPAVHRWVSAEPLLEAIDLQLDCNGYESNGPAGWVEEEGIDQLIVGGESGPGARPCDVEWIRSLRDQCRDAGTKFYCKQIGSNAIGEVQDTVDEFRMAQYWTEDSHGADPAEWPADLRVRELGWR